MKRNHSYSKYKNQKKIRYDVTQNDDFLRTMHKVFSFARWFGVPYGGPLFLAWCTILFLMLLAIEIGAICKVVRALNEKSTDSPGGQVFMVLGSVVARLSGSIFYGNAVISSFLTWRFASSWKGLSYDWAVTEKNTRLILPSDDARKKKLFAVILIVSLCSVVEHALSMMSATGFDCPPSEYFEKYILSSHGFLLRIDEYTLWLAVPVFIMSKTATCMWNFQDSIIILISIGLASRYRSLNLYVRNFVHRLSDASLIQADTTYNNYMGWRKIREAYVRQAALIRKIDEKLGSLILLSNLNNFYFICLQLFLGIGGDKPSFINKLYYLLSLAWLCFRACSVVLVAADIQVQSRQALKYLHAASEETNNIEVQRLEKQLSKDFVALSGCGFFYLDRNMLLKVTASILTYELVLLQYDT